MQNELSKVFEQMGLINHIDLKKNTSDLFINGSTCSIWIVEIDPEWTLEEIDSHFTDVFEEQNVICSSSHELEIRLDSFLAAYSATQNKGLYFLISQNIKAELDLEAPYFLTGMGASLKALEDYSDGHQTFINGLKDYRATENPYSNYADFLRVYEEKVASEYEKLIRETDSKLPSFWMIGNGIMLPNTLAESTDSKDFETVIYCNEIAIQWFLLSANSNKLVSVSETDLKGLLCFINEIKSNINEYKFDRIRVGNVEEYRFRKDGNYFINELTDTEIDHYFEGVEFNVYMLVRENGKIDFNNKTKIYDGYNTGGICDIKDILYELSKVTPMGHIEFIAKLS